MTSVSVSVENVCPSSISFFFGGTSMSGPARVANAVASLKRLEADDFFKVTQFAFRAPQLQLVPVAGDGDSGRVVAAVLKPPQTLDNDRNYFLLADIANNSTHAGTP